MYNQQDKGNRADAKATGLERLFPPQIPRWKRVLDLAILFFLAWAIAPLCAIIALFIKRGSEGPVLFRQQRVGYKGRQFTCFKFRTMRAGAEVQSHKAYTRQLIRSRDPMAKLDDGNDPRVIPHGRFLRATGLDELPQLLNVLRGEMSFVGPRPCIPYEYEAYEPWHRRRLDAVPGLTGLWQVSGKNHTTFEEMVKLDITYSIKQSLWLDLNIILKTPFVILNQFRELRAVKRTEKQSEKKELRPTPLATLGRILSFRL